MDIVDGYSFMVNGEEYKVTLTKPKQFSAEKIGEDLKINLGLGDKALIGNTWFKVSYINHGQHRVTFKQL